MWAVAWDRSGRGGGGRAQIPGTAQAEATGCPADWMQVREQKGGRPGL